MPVLVCRKTRFYSQIDENAFFTMLKSIKAVRSIEGHGADILVSVSSRISDASLRELLGVFFRFRVNMRQLAKFETQKNRAWFRREEAYWFRRVFR